MSATVLSDCLKWGFQRTPDPGVWAVYYRPGLADGTTPHPVMHGPSAGACQDAVTRGLADMNLLRGKGKVRDEPAR